MASGNCYTTWTPMRGVFGEPSLVMPARVGVTIVYAGIASSEAVLTTCQSPPEVSRFSRVRTGGDVRQITGLRRFADAL
jgi:hypothetical protein